jgi:exopolysaccharide production protein ExoY
LALTKIKEKENMISDLNHQTFINQNVGYFLTKRILDLVGALVGIILLSPFILIVAILIKVQDPRGPLFFKQQRIGLNGKIFYIYKFRSMVVDAEKKLKENHELYQKYLENNFKLDQDEDPRITRFGAFIRKTSLDELPQFINVLKGEMSLVGPRPVVIDELNRYEDRKSDFLSVKPGITGYWQVCGRSDVGYPERVEIELYYVYHKCLLLDIKILFKTVIQVLARKGAY